tara:strand:+ start:103 stop:492 length:390 start_codon:yes stop_codon:yes gene_type:complete
MRKITRETAEAFLEGRIKSMGNTSTDGMSYFLHGNRIAYKPSNLLSGEGIRFSMRGWATVTTRERLNGILECMGEPYRIIQRHYDQYLIKLGGISPSCKPTILNTCSWFTLPDPEAELIEIPKQPEMFA